MNADHNFLAADYTLSRKRAILPTAATRALPCDLGFQGSSFSAAGYGPQVQKFKQLSVRYCLTGSVQVIQHTHLGLLLFPFSFQLSSSMAIY